MVPIGLVGRQTGTPAAATTIWAMRNLGTTSLYIRRIYLMASFDGAAAATTQSYQVQRFRTATPTGGTALTVIKKFKTAVASGVTDAREAVAGVTIGAMTFDTTSYMLIQPRQIGPTTVADIEFQTIATNQSLIIAPNDGLCIVLGVAGVVGESLAGFVEWDE